MPFSRWYLTARVVATALAVATGLLLVAPGGRDAGPARTDRVEPVAQKEKRSDTWRAPLRKGPRVGTFNVLGANHTEPGGDRKGWKRYGWRLRRAIPLMEKQNLSVVGMQEFQGPQRTLFFRLTKDRRMQWRLSPKGNETNGILWRPGKWRLVRAGRIKVPYFHGKPVGMPYVLLRRTGTREKVWFVNVHNPASAKGPAAKYRKIALRREARLVKRLRRTGRPVMLIGDLNQRESGFCYLAKRGMRASAGGSFRPDWPRGQRCRPPKDVRIDWLFIDGGKRARLGGHRVESRTRKRGISDHPIVISSLPAYYQRPDRRKRGRRH